MHARELAERWYDLFHRYAEDLYPGRYTREKCLELAEMALEIQALARQKGSTIVVHNYLYPEFHEIADKVGDSLGLSYYVRDAGARRVDFQAVFFMASTAKIIVGDQARVFVNDTPQALGCSLVFGTDYEWVENWKRAHLDGIVVTYINSDVYTKALSDFVTTSRNTDAILVYAARHFPGRKILFLPDKYLGYVMRARAARQGVDPNLIEIYEYSKDGWNACCYVHEKIGTDALTWAVMKYHRELASGEAELMIHPECGCASYCLSEVESGRIPHGSAYFLSTEQMVERAKASPARKFIVATEKGLVYRLRKEVPEKEFVPVAAASVCDYMKANTFEKLLRSLREDRIEIVFCDDCCDPKNPYQDEAVVHVPRSVAARARRAIEQMLEIR